MSDDDTEHPIRIFVLDRGFVFVGRMPDVSGCGMWITAKCCRCIRVWGTSQGLSELINGPLANTRMDDVMPSMTFGVRAHIYTIDEVNQTAWAQHLKLSSGARTRRSAVAS